jgi:hypothetical protein
MNWSGVTVEGMLRRNRAHHQKQWDRPRPLAHVKKRIFRLQNPKPTYCQHKECVSTSPERLLRTFRLDSVYLWTCEPCRRREDIKNPQFVCENAVCGMACWKVYGSRGRKVCSACYEFDRHKGKRPLSVPALPTLAEQQHRPHPVPTDYVCENATCNQVCQTSGTWKQGMHASFPRWVCHLCYRHEQKRKIYRNIGPDGKAFPNGTGMVGA